MEAEYTQEVAITDEAVDRLREGLLDWYDDEGRSLPWRGESIDTYVKIVAEVLLQRTTAPAVAEVLPCFLQQYGSWEELADSRIEELEELIRPLGLWRRRARSLMALAKAILDRGGEYPSARSEAESLPGVGQYIASAILLICHGKREPLLDSNMARLLERYFGPREKADIRSDPYLQCLSRRLVNHRAAKKINWAVLDFGAAVCKPRRPLCMACPVRDGCQYSTTAAGGRSAPE